MKKIGLCGAEYKIIYEKFLRDCPWLQGTLIV